MLDMERLARLTSIYIDDKRIDDRKLNALPAEFQGFFEMLGIGPQPTSTKRSRSSSISVGMQKSMGAKCSTKARINPHLQMHDIDVRAVETWGFDILGLGDGERRAVLLYLFFDSSIGRSVDRTWVDVDTFHAFTDSVMAAYNPNPYHNFLHATDILQTVYRIMCDTSCKRWLSDVEQYALMVSALCHDIGHLGFNNQFLVETGDKLAIRYNDQSPLENMHCATMFKIMSDYEAQVFKVFDKDSERKVARRVCIATILHTDMVHHFDMVKKLAAIFERNREICLHQAQDLVSLTSAFEDEVLGSNKMFFLELFLHLSDISNPTKPFHLSKVWAEWCLEEMFRQGDEEKRLGIPVGMLNDREQVNIAGSQHGFINFVVAPLVLGTSRIFGSLLHLGVSMSQNLEEWQEIWIESATRPPTDEDVLARGAEVRRFRDECEKIKVQGMPASCPALGRRTLMAPIRSSLPGNRRVSA